MTNVGILTLRNLTLHIAVVHSFNILTCGRGVRGSVAGIGTGNYLSV
jgi:hypothetical protein